MSKYIFSRLFKKNKYFDSDENLISSENLYFLMTYILRVDFF